MKKIIVFVLSFSLLFCTPMSVCAGQMLVDDENIKAKSVVLLDMDSREVLYAKNENEELSPASVTKIMSLLLIMQALDNGKISLDDKVVASKDAVAMGGSQIWLEVGEEMTVDELLKAVIIASANDACTALGELVGGSGVGFVKMMNDEARNLGLKHTNFENCTGLDDDVKAHYSSAYDLALIACEVMKYEQVTQYTTVWLDSLREGKTELNNTNKLVNTYEGLTGLKTGTTSNAGFCICATASRNDMNLVAVVLGSTTSQDRFDTAAYLLDMGFANYKSVSLELDNEQIKDIRVNNGTTKYIKPAYSSDEKITISNDNSELTYNYNIPKSVNAPIQKGDVLASVEVCCGEELVKTINLYSPQDVDRITFRQIFLRLLKKI